MNSLFVIISRGSGTIRRSPDWQTLPQTKRHHCHRTRDIRSIDRGLIFRGRKPFRLNERGHKSATARIATLPVDQSFKTHHAHHRTTARRRSPLKHHRHATTFPRMNESRRRDPAATRQPITSRNASTNQRSSTRTAPPANKGQAATRRPVNSQGWKPLESRHPDQRPSPNGAPVRDTSRKSARNPPTRQKTLARSASEGDTTLLRCDSTAP